LLAISTHLRAHQRPF